MKHKCLFLALSAILAAWCVPAAERPAPTEKEKVFIFVGHPDDTIACAGTMFLMKDLFELHVGVFTHGERGCGEKGFRDGSTRAIRTKEEEAAAAMVGAKVHWFEEVDGDAYPNREVCHQVADLLKELKPRAVIAMWPLDFHLDHAMSCACVQKAIGIAGMRDRIEFYFMEESYDSRTFMPAYYVDVTDVMELKREFIRKHVCQNPNDSMCIIRRGKCHVERFAVYDGKPQGHRCIFTELPPPKGWSQDWKDAKPSRFTPEGGMK